MSKTQKEPLTAGYLYLNKKAVLLLKLLDLLTHSFFKKRSKPDNINKILIVKPDHAGDVLMMTSILPFIKNTYPFCRIDVICGSWSVEILTGNHYIRKIIQLDHFMLNRDKVSFPAKFLRHTYGFLKALAMLRYEKYDAAFVLRAYGGNLITLLRLGGVKYIAGHPTGGFSALLDSKAVWRAGVHEVEHYLEVLRAAGIAGDANRFRYELYTEEAEEARVAKLIDSEIGGPFVVIHPGAGDRRKLLPAKSWTGIIEKIDMKYSVVFTGTSSEMPYFSEIQRKRDAVNLMGKLNIKELYLLYKRAACVFTVESLSAHIGACAGVKTIVFCGGINDIAQWRPLGDNVVIIRKDIECSPCLNGCKDMDCMKDLAAVMSHS
ncbi:MAG: glycosyltransferase family 9 protein [Nitrospirae bacterium YQR-1]